MTMTVDERIREHTLAEVGRVLESLTFGSVRVIHIVHRFDTNANGDRAGFLDITLADPTDETWPSDEVRSLRRTVREHLLAAGFDLPFYAVLHQESDEPQEEDGAGAPT